MADEEGGKAKKCSGRFCSCVECGGRKRKENEAKKGKGE
jgi:hypothetical protein